MTNAPLATIEDFRDIESLNHYAEAVAGGRGARRRAARAAQDGPRQRAHADAVGRGPARRLHHRRAVAAGQPEPRRDQRRGRAREPGLGLPPLPPADRAAPRAAGRRRRRLHDAAGRTTSASTRSRARSTASSCSCSATSPATRSSSTSRAGTTPSRSIGSPGLTLGPVGGHARTGARRTGSGCAARRGLPGDDRLPYSLCPPRVWARRPTGRGCGRCSNARRSAP